MKLANVPEYNTNDFVTIRNFAKITHELFCRFFGVNFMFSITVGKRSIKILARILYFQLL